MTVQQVPLDQITDNMYNPRSHYDPERTKELASSIEQNGLLEVPKARLVAVDTYELAYGGYRFRAFKLLAKKDKERWGSMPLDVIEISDTSMVIFALEENLKRNTMTPIDTARAVAKYLQLFPGVREEDLAIKLSMAQGTISNMVRVVTLPNEVLKYVDNQTISFTQARELCTLQDIDSLTKGAFTSKLLMIDAINLIGTEGYASTVAGMKKAIHRVVHDNFRTLSKDGFTNPPVFDTVDCLKCEKGIKTTDESGKPAYHCIDFQCWDLHQAQAKRKIEEEEAAAIEEIKAGREARERAEAEAAEKVRAEEASKPTVIPQEIKPYAPRVFYVDPKRLAVGGNIFESYSAKNIFNKEPISPPFQEVFEDYIGVGDYPEIPGAKQCYRVIPRADYSGDLRSLTSPEGVDAESYRKQLKADPLGPYNGVLVTWSGKEYVMAGPVVVFAPWEKAPEPVLKEPETGEGTEETKNAPERKVEKEEAEPATTETVPGAAAEVAPAAATVEYVDTRYNVWLALEVVIDDRDVHDEELRARLWDAWEKAHEEQQDDFGPDSIGFQKLP